MVIQLSPTGIAYTSFRHWRTILVFTLLGLASTIAYTLVATPKYEADAQLVVHFSTQPTLTPGAAPAGAASQTPADYAEIINDYMNMLAGNDLAEGSSNRSASPRCIRNTSRTICGCSRPWHR